MLGACAWHARRIRFGFAYCSFPLPARAGRGSGFLNAARAISSPGIVLGPIVDFVRAFITIQESNLGESTYEFSGVAGPLGSDTNILAAHAYKIAYRTVPGDPKEEFDKRPASLSAESALEFDRLGVARQRRRDSGVVSHRLYAFPLPGRAGTPGIGSPVENSTLPNSRNYRSLSEGAQHGCGW